MPARTRACGRRVAQLAEELGYDSLWAGEHVVVPSPRVEPSPMDPDDPILDPLVALAHLAGATERIRLGTGLVILPQRNPLVLAKQVASLDVVSGGRLILGLGVGYLEPELRAMGVPMAGRGARADEYLAAMRSLWEDEAPSFSGRYVEFEGVDAHPRPLQSPLPVVIGGHSHAAHLRAARHGDGWYGFLLGLRAMSGAGRVTAPGGGGDRTRAAAAHLGEPRAPARRGGGGRLCGAGGGAADRGAAPGAVAGRAARVRRAKRAGKVGRGAGSCSRRAPGALPRPAC